MTSPTWNDRRESLIPGYAPVELPAEVPLDLVPRESVYMEPVMQFDKFDMAPERMQEDGLHPVSIPNSPTHYPQSPSLLDAPVARSDPEAIWEEDGIHPVYGSPSRLGQSSYLGDGQSPNFVPGLLIFESHRTSVSTDASIRQSNRSSIIFKRSGLSSRQGDFPKVVPEDIAIRFSAKGSTVVLWRRNVATYLVRIYLPGADLDEVGGQKLQLVETSGRGVGASEGIDVRHVAAGHQGVAAISHKDGIFTLNYFNGAGSRSCARIQYNREPPSDVAVSPNDDMVVVAVEGGVRVYLLQNGQLDSIPTHEVPPNPTECQPRDRRRIIQFVRFSPNSTELVSAVQQGERIYAKVYDLSNRHGVMPQLYRTETKLKSVSDLGPCIL
jgi:hypothetical protein